jgi:hypothetical protein
MRNTGPTVTRSVEQHRDKFAGIARALRAGLAVPTDTFITDDIPLLLTKLSQLPPAGAGSRDADRRTEPRIA